MEVVQVDGLDGAREARGVVVVIDVFRAFTVSAYALEGGALECRLVTTVDEALRLQRGIPGSVVSAEEEGLPVPGIPISNSPTQICAIDLAGRILIQRTSDGTRGVAAATAAHAVLACSFVVAAATARHVVALEPDLVTLVAMGTPRGHQEDRACAEYLRDLLAGCPADPDALISSLHASPRYKELAAGAAAGFPASDVELALLPDRFDFAMPVTRDARGLYLVKGP